MGIKLIKIFMPCLVYLVGTSAFAEAEVEKIILHTGDAKTIELKDAVRVHVTRKGIIHLVHDHDDYWSITALRTGVVAIETKLKSSDPRTIYADVRPRPEKSPQARVEPRESPHAAVSTCDPGDIQYETHATIELVDDYKLEATGIDSDTILSWRDGIIEKSIGVSIDPRQSKFNRHIVGDPVITSRPCEDLVIRAGGEDEFQSKTDSGHVISTWKSHGLDIKLKLMPIGEQLIKVPFSVSLRTPSRGKGSYGLSDVTSAINIKTGQKMLAAIINLSSSSASTKEQPWLTSVPIIGPFFRNSEDSRSTSKLLLWFEIFQISAATPSP